MAGRSHSSSVTQQDPTRLLSLAHSIFYLLTGVWPLVSIRSFEWVTGKKRDDWLVKTVGAQIALAGAVIGLPAVRRREPGESTATIAIGVPLILAAVDVIYYRRGILRWVYLLDAVAEVVLAAGWALTLGRSRRPR